MLRKPKDNRLYCFSPPVMLATLVIEFSLAIYTVWRYKMTKVSRLAVVTLTALGAFQLAEYMTCGGLGLTNTDWARFGYISITLLPALGIHMITAIAGKKKPWLVNAAYATCAAFVAYYAFHADAISSQACYANYAVFYTAHISSLFYGIYYYGWLLIGTWLALDWSNHIPKRRVALRAMALGYLVFILPTTFFNIIDPTTIRGIPSIMCGFAVLFALAIAIKVLPNSAIVCKRSKNAAREIEQS